MTRPHRTMTPSNSTDRRAPMLRARPLLTAALAACLSGHVAAQERSDAAYRAATGLLQRDMPEQAAAEFRSFLRDHPDDAKSVSARYGLAVCLTRLGQWKEAAQELDAISGAR